MFDKFLLPIDPSKRLRPARNYALALAKRLDVPLIATYVSNPSKTGTVTASSETRRGFEALGKRQLDQFVEENSDINVLVYTINLNSSPIFLNTSNFFLVEKQGSLKLFYTNELGDKDLITQYNYRGITSFTPKQLTRLMNLEIAMNVPIVEK